MKTQTWQTRARLMAVGSFFGVLTPLLAQQVADPTPVPVAAPAPMAVTAPVPVVEPASVAVKAPEEVKAAATSANDLVSMEFTDAKIQDVLRALALMRPGTNILMGPDVQASVTFVLKDVAWETALQLICESNNFKWERVADNVYKVSKIDKTPQTSLVIEMLAKSDVPAIPAEVAVALARAIKPDATWTVESARSELAKNPQRVVRSIQVDARPAIEVINELAKKAGLNYAFSGDVGSVKPAAAPGEVVPGVAPVTMHFTYLSVDDALKLVGQQGSLQCINQNGVWTVKGVGGKGELDPLKTETMQVKFIPLNEELLKTLRTFMTERGKISSNGNKLIVRDTAESIESIRNSLAIMDTATPQVMIEARFFVLNDGLTKELGIDWGALGGADGGLRASTGPNSFDYTHKITESAAAPRAGDSTWNTVATFNMDKFNLILRALNSNSNAKQLANPKVVVSSDQQATIHIGEQRPMVKSNVSTNGGDQTVTFELDGDFGGETVEEDMLLPSGATQTRSKKTFTSRKGYLDLGTLLTVAPSVKTDEQIYIKVVPELTTFVEDVRFAAGGTVITYPKLNVTSVKTEFTIRSGQTIAIGGLVNEKVSKKTVKVPLLGDIPYLRFLFAYDTNENSREENVIFLTVTLIPSEKMLTTSGIPVRAAMVQGEVDRIKREDAEGAAYSEDRARVLYQKEEKERNASWFDKFKRDEPVPATTLMAEPSIIPPAPVPAPAPAPAVESAPAPAEAK